MSITLAFTLPATPSAGTIQRFALGGDGYRSPSGVYVVRDVSITGDNTGGFMAIQMGFDPNFVSMIGYCSASISQGTPTLQKVKFQHVGALMATMQENIEAIAANAGNVPEIAVTWSPPAMLIPGVRPGTTTCQVDNTEDDVFIFNASIFLYDIRAMENFPIDLLVAARGGV